MARGGINKAIVQKARDVLLAKGENPSIDAIRIEMGNTGSKTTIHRYLKELEEASPRALLPRQCVSDELTALIAGVLERVMEEGGAALTEAQRAFDEQRTALEQSLQLGQQALVDLQRQFDSQRVALEGQTAELHTCSSSLQVEQTRNARLSQQCADLEVRVMEKDQHIRSLEEKHVHARDALEHYRNAVKEQREQEQRRHESQVQQVQAELRQMQQMHSVKLDETTRLNRDNERLLNEVRHLGKTAAVHEDTVQRLSNEITALKLTTAKTDGAKELLQEQVVLLRVELEKSSEAARRAVQDATATRSQLDTATAKLEALSSQLAASEAHKTSEGR